MAKKKNTHILDVDAVLATFAKRGLILGGELHPISGLTGRVYLEFGRKRTALAEAIEAQDTDKIWQLNIELIMMVCPTITEDALMNLPIPVLNTFAEFVRDRMNETVEEQGAGPAAEDGDAAEPGESV